MTSQKCRNTENKATDDNYSMSWNVYEQEHLQIYITIMQL